MYTRLAFQKVVDAFAELCDCLIMIGHIKEKSLEKKGKEITVSELDLSGKNKSSVSASVDAIGYLYREKGKCYISFDSKDEVLCGARSKHLRNADILISEEQADGSIKTFWENIFINNNK